ncbi:peptidylprolyl isomerase d (cyclophilin d) [Plasmopara halstedii]|uniref:peptidylprolyl isomerase n=1 Tax=Plasmopara halstedii TaxID=4781 RepID=A0A0P1A5N4_PLAHL|nr:peptidylprolyl isomerase d (cyclophilin d) [Plasmopara halstedii]CEG35518.1 peptidylprolyl isomerase d (cyclophilin d) [Plasmopara halstedii]|eukprot:XP_024571887.1 peptidylprolyl isomerase d (cyclophilin d) [Plasmopara halstedii]
MSINSEQEELQSSVNIDLPHCIECGGYGVGLITNPQKLCTHCARKTKAFFDPDANEFCKNEGFVDISPTADGGVLKKIIKEGEWNGKRRLEEGCPTFVHYVGRLLDGSIFDTTRDVIDGKHVGGTDDPFEFQLGREKVIKGWDIGVATMTVGEIARFIIAPEYGYGHAGFAPKVEPDETLDFEIELLSFKDPLPRFPTQAELAESRKKQIEEDKKLLEENPPPTVDERITSALEQKEKGNALIALKNYDQAQKCYDSGFVHIFYTKEEWENFVSQEDKDKVNKVKSVLYLNRALCKIKLKKIEDALWDCDQAILLDPKNSKGHFRRGLVFTEKLKAELEKEKNGEFWIVDKGFEYANEAEKSLKTAKDFTENSSDYKMLQALADLKRNHALLSKYAARYKEDEKKLYKEKIFDRLQAKNKKLEQQEKLKAEAEEFDDMPALE